MGAARNGSGGITEQRRRARASAAGASETSRNQPQPNLNSERGATIPQAATMYAQGGALEDMQRPWKSDIYEMANRDPQVQALMIAAALPMLTSSGHLEPAEDDNGEAEFVERVLTGEPWEGGMKTPILTLLEQECTAMFYRQAFFEVVWNRSAEDGRFGYDKVAFRDAQSCRIRHDEQNGSFNGFIQEGTRPGTGQWFREEFDPLYSYVYVHGAAQRPLLGTSVLQAVWHEHMHKQKLRWLQFRGFNKMGTGILVSETERQDTAEVDELRDAMNKVLDGGVLAVGEGELPTLLTGNMAQGFLEVLQYIDSAMARALLLQGLQLGTGSQTGSWALGKEHMDFFVMSEEARRAQIAQNRNAYLIPPLVEQNFPNSKAYPQWKFPGLTDEGKELAKEIFIALLGRPQASVHPVIKATTEKSVAEQLGADPENIPEWDADERTEALLPEGVAPDGAPAGPANDPQRAAEGSALQQSLQALRVQTGASSAPTAAGQVAAAEQGDTPLGASVTYERFLELADLHGDAEAERMLREYVRDSGGRFAAIPGVGTVDDYDAERGRVHVSATVPHAGVDELAAVAAAYPDAHTVRWSSSDTPRAVDLKLPQASEPTLSEVGAALQHSDILRAMEEAALNDNEGGYRTLAGALVSKLRADPKVRDAEALAAWIGRHHHKPGIKGVNKDEKPDGGDAAKPDPAKRIEASKANEREKQRKRIYDASGDELFNLVTGRKPSGDADKDLAALMGADQDRLQAAHSGRLNKLFTDLEDKEKQEKRDRERGKKQHEVKPAEYASGDKIVFGLQLTEDAVEAQEMIGKEFPDLRNHFNGKVEDGNAHKGKGYWGVADWNGVIGMSPELDSRGQSPYRKGYLDEHRRHTMLHEMLHMHSPGHGGGPGGRSPDSLLYGEMPGWEEAVVERNARLIADKNIPKGEAGAERRKHQKEIRYTHPYNRYIKPLEKLRKDYDLGKPTEFWQELMRTPLAERRNRVMDMARGKDNYTDFLRALQDVDKQMGSR